MNRARKINKSWLPWARRRRLCARGGIVALALQLLIPFGQGLPLDAFAGGNGEVSASLVNCEFMRGTAAPAKDGSAPDPSGSYPSCPVCQANCLGQNLLPAQRADLLKPLDVVGVFVKALADHVSVERTITGKHPRAPPYSA